MSVIRTEDPPDSGIRIGEMKNETRVWVGWACSVYPLRRSSSVTTSDIPTQLDFPSPSYPNEPTLTLLTRGRQAPQEELQTGCVSVIRTEDPPGASPLYHVSDSM